MKMSPKIVRSQEQTWLVHHSPVSFWGWLIELCRFVRRSQHPQPFAPTASLFHDSIITGPQYSHLTNYTFPLPAQFLTRASRDSAFYSPSMCILSTWGVLPMQLRRLLFKKSSSKIIWTKLTSGTRPGVKLRAKNWMRSVGHSPTMQWRFGASLSFDFKRCTLVGRITASKEVTTSCRDTRSKACKTCAFLVISPVIPGTIQVESDPLWECELQHQKLSQNGLYWPCKSPNDPLQQPYFPWLSQSPWKISQHTSK